MYSRGCPYECLGEVQAHLAGPKDRIQVVRLGNKCLYPLSHLAGPPHCSSSFLPPFLSFFRPVYFMGVLPACMSMPGTIRGQKSSDPLGLELETLPMSGTELRSSARVASALNH